MSIKVLYFISHYSANRSWVWPMWLTPVMLQSYFFFAKQLVLQYYHNPYSLLHEMMDLVEFCNDVARNKPSMYRQRLLRSLQLLATNFQWTQLVWNTEYIHDSKKLDMSFYSWYSKCWNASLAHVTYGITLLQFRFNNWYLTRMRTLQLIAQVRCIANAWYHVRSTCVNWDKHQFVKYV